MPSRPRTLLIIDDDAQARAGYRWRLEHDVPGHYAIVEEALGQTGLSTARQLRPDCVIVKEALPDLRGLDVVAALAAESPAAGEPRLVDEIAVVMVCVRVDHEAALRAIGYGAQACLRPPESEGGPPQPPPDLSWVLAAAVARVEQGRARREQLRALEEQQRELDARIARLRIAEEQLHATLLSEREARVAAETECRLKDEFLATISHELRTPLSAITGWAQMLRGDELDEPMTQSALAAIDRNAKAQAQIIEDLFDVSRIVTGKLRLEQRPIELWPIVQAAVDTLRPAADFKGVTMHAVTDGPGHMVLGDPDRLQQVIWNLLSNAVKFTPAGGRVDIRVERQAKEVAIHIADTGRGIAPDFLPFVFESFRQEGGGTTKRHSGLGLGLAIARNLIELHGGRATAHSDGLGKGATFTVRMPILTTTAPGSTPREASESDGTTRSTDATTATRGSRKAPASTPKEPGPLAGIRVLLVEDDADTRAVLAFALGRYGAEVKAVSSVATALQQLAAGRPDVLVSDIGMPERDGYSLLAELRAAEAGSADPTPLPAIALTAYARSEDAAQALAAGFQVHLAKPVVPSVLVRTIAQLMGRRAARS